MLCSIYAEQYREESTVFSVAGCRVVELQYAICKLAIERLVRFEF